MLRSDLFDEFKRLLKLENISKNKLFTQFMKSYVYFMDQSYVKNNYSKLSRKVPKIHITVEVPANVYTEFAKKLAKEKIHPKKIGPILVEQYINYVSNLHPANEKK